MDGLTCTSCFFTDEECEFYPGASDEDFEFYPAASDDDINFCCDFECKKKKGAYCASGTSLFRGVLNTPDPY